MASTVEVKFYILCSEGQKVGGAFSSHSTRLRKLGLKGCKNNAVWIQSIDLKRG